MIIDGGRGAQCANILILATRATLVTIWTEYWRTDLTSSVYQRVSCDIEMDLVEEAIIIPLELSLPPLIPKEHPSLPGPPREEPEHWPIVALSMA